MNSSTYTTRIAFIGGGNMASALIGGLLQRGYDATRMQVVDLSETARRQLADRFGVTCSAAIEADAMRAADVIVLAVKPQQLHEAAKSLKPMLRQQLVLTIAAGVRVADLSRWLGNYGRIARAMPNTPALVLAGASALYATDKVEAKQRQDAYDILSAVGSVIWVDEEVQLDAVTAVSGSGPAYVFYFIEALDQAAREMGLDAAQSRQLVIDTFVGAAKLVAASPDSAAVLRERVTSKGGTTERALSEFNAAGLKDLIVSAVKTAAVRSRELGDTFGQTG